MSTSFFSSEACIISLPRCVIVHENRYLPAIGVVKIPVNGLYAFSSLFNTSSKRMACPTEIGLSLPIRAEKEMLLCPDNTVE